MKNEEAESVYLEETATATVVYNRAMTTANRSRDSEVRSIRAVYANLAIKIQEKGRKSLNMMEETEFAAMEAEIRDVEQRHRVATAPIRRAYEAAIAPAQRHLQEARSRGGRKSPSELAASRRGTF